MKRTILFLFLGVYLFLLDCQSVAAEDSIIFSDEAVSVAVNVQRKYETYLFGLQGVKGVGIGSKDSQLGILVLVEKKAPEFELPKSLEGMPVIVEEVGQIVAHQANLGVSTGNDINCSCPCPQLTCECNGSGTIGFKVCDTINPGVVGFVTNNHVATSGCPGRCPNNAPVGTDMFSPSIPDNGWSTSGATNVGTLNRFIPLILDGTTPNLVDAAFVMSDDDLISDYLQGLGNQNSETVSPFIGQVVCKSGRTTGVTCGTVTGINITGSVAYPRAGDPSPGSCGTGGGKFVNLVKYSPSPPYSIMSQSGDSGAPVVDSSNRAVALNFAGDGKQDGYGIPMSTVLQELQVSLCNQVSNVSPSEGTIGTVFTVTGLGFGTAKPKVYVEYEKTPGIYGKSYATVISWNDSSVTCRWIKKLSPGTYSLFVQPSIKAVSPIDSGTFSIMNPVIEEVNPNRGLSKDIITIQGEFYTTKKPIIYLENVITFKRKSCKVLNFMMNPDTGISSLQLIVPNKLDLGEYNLILKNLIGEARDRFTCALPDTTPPTSPILTATAVSISRIDLSWNAATDDIGVSGYKIHNSNGTHLHTVNGTSTYFDGLDSGTQYCYTVTAHDDAGNESAHSNQACATTLSQDTTAPSVPTLTASAVSTSQIDLSWNASTDNVGVSGYKVYSGNGTYLASGIGTSTYFTGLNPNTQYCYKVTAYDAVGNESGFSNTACATTMSAVDPIYEKTLLLNGKWRFIYTIGSTTFTDDYFLTTITGDRNDQGGYFIFGTNQYGDIVGASYFPDDGIWALLDQGIIIDQFYVFYTDGNSILSNSCYFLITKSTGNWSRCYALSGYKYSTVTSTIKSSEKIGIKMDKNTEETIKANEAEEGVVDDNIKMKYEELKY